MMREIKFRAWTGLNIIHDFLVGRPQFADPLKIMTDKDFAKSQYGLNDWVVMQYTGLKDKNGVEIFDGDIVKQFGNPKPESVEFFNSAWRLYRLYILGTEIKPESVEVIGNIYQNPELLNT